MPSGGARARSGPPVNPNSARSDARGIAFRQLAGVPDTAPVPEFAMPPMQLWETLPNGGRRFRKLATELRWKRELELWEWVWHQPQSEVWREQPWMTYNVAQWVRLAVTCEEEGAKAGDKTALLRLADQIGLTASGLALHQWQITTGQPADQAEPSERPARRRSSRARLAGMTVVDGGSDGA